MFVLKTKLIHAMCKNTFEILIIFHSDNCRETIFVTVFGNSSCKCMWIKDWTHGSALSTIQANHISFERHFSREFYGTNCDSKTL